MSADGSGQRALTRDSSEPGSPDWSPDGRKILFSAATSSGFSQIFLMNADGTGRRSLTSDPGHKGSPDWSPDGSKIAIDYSRPGPLQGLAVMNADGSGWTDLTAGPTERDFGPKWSPDGRKIAFARFLGNNGEIFVMNADGSGLTNLTNSAASDCCPAWSPDGTRIAFSTEHRPGAQLWVMNADGGAKTLIVSPPRGAVAPAWSPDGGKIAFSTELFRAGPMPEIFVINADGRGLTNLTRNAAKDGSPDWHSRPLRRLCVVPRVVGQTLRRARSRIRRADCSVGRIRFGRSASPRGKVIRQNPRPGTQRPRGTRVNLLVSRGR